MVMLRAILTTSSPLCSILWALSTAIFGKWSACKGRNIVTRNQSKSILVVDEPIVVHYRITSIQVTALFVLTFHLFVQDIIRSFGAPVLDTPGIILWSHVLQTVDLQAWEAADTVNYCLTAQSTVLDEAKRISGDQACPKWAPWSWPFKVLCPGRINHQTWSNQG